jgi:hypothetical protein
MQYPDLVAALSFYLQEEQPSASYTGALPTIINNAEQRIFKDLGSILANRAVNASLVFSPGSRTLSLSGVSGTTLNGLPVLWPFPVTIEGLTAIVPAWQAPWSGGRVRYQPVSWAFIDMVWPNESVVSQPGNPFAYFAMLDDQTLITAPTPDLQYTAEVIGTWRPAPMSEANPETWVGDHLPELLFDACMVEATGYQRDYGAQSDDPRMAVSWEARYTASLGRAREEEVRRRIGRPPPVQFPMVTMPAAPGRPA